jgi:FkbM family methyltransferase
MLTREQTEDRESVWRAMKERHPEFTEWMDPLNNYHAVREIVLGGSVTWAGVHERFKPCLISRVMDIGANAGIFTAFCAANRSLVYAYEPFLRPYAVLRGMLDASDLNRYVVAQNAAVWTYTGKVQYFGNVSTLDNVCPAFNGGVKSDGINWTPDDERISVEVKCISLEAALGEVSWDCVKVDVEGAEFEMILACPEETLRQIRFMYIEFHPWASAELYHKTIDKLKAVYKFEGSVMRTDGRWEAAYLTAR